MEAADLRQNIKSLTHRLQTPSEEYEHLFNECVQSSTLVEVRCRIKVIKEVRGRVKVISEVRG